MQKSIFLKWAAYAVYVALTPLFLIGVGLYLAALTVGNVGVWLMAAAYWLRGDRFNAAVIRQQLKL